ncbi:MAG: hypothetical protein J6Y72_09190 [Bacteroidales bacterium]|nr:hypothetical protein [Bacteroidales bacterium]
MIEYSAKLKAIATSIVLMLSLTISAQNSTSSPYSLYGMGILAPKENAAAAGMGHTGVALAPSDWVNIANPAALSGLDSLTFYFNFQVKAFYAHEATSSHAQSVYSGNIDGITMGFRGSKWWAACIGYAPYSTVGYNMTEKKNIAGTANSWYDIYYTGSGGLQQAFFNNAVTLFDHITLGIGAGAIWGAISKKETADFSNTEITTFGPTVLLGGERVYNLKKYTMNNWYLEYGIQFDFNIGKNNFRLGATFSDRTNMHSSYDHIVSNDISSELFFDDVTPLEEEFAVPRMYAGGLAYTRGKFTATCDYHFNEWGDVLNVKFGESINFRDNHSIGGGMEWRCGRREDPFYKRLTFRLGGYYESSYIKMRGVTLGSYAGTLGITIPMGRSANSIVIGYEYRKRGTTFNGLVEEKFNNFKIALNIHETWFMKSKFD